MHSIEQQTPSEADLLEQLRLAERELLMLDKDDRVLSNLSLTIQIYFNNGGNDEGKQKILNLIDKYKNQYPSALKSHFAAFRSTGFVKLTDKSYQSAFAKAKDSNVLEWHFTSAESGQFSGDYALGVVTERDNAGLTHMHLNFPISMIYSDKGRKEYYDWIKYVLSHFEVFHGYAGLSIQLPFDRHPYQFYEYEVSKKYWGITPDGASFFRSEWMQGIRSINWYTFIGAELRNQLVAQPNYLDTMKAYPELSVEEIGQTLSFKAGPLPRLGDKALALPLPYVVINQLCRVVRTEMPSDAMHTAYRGPRYSQSEVYYWIHRWDSANFDQGILNLKGRKEELLPVLGDYSNDDNIVPYTGIWIPFDFEGLGKELKKGQEFPEEAEYDWNDGELDSKPAVWKLAKREDGGPVLLPNPF